MELSARSGGSDPDIRAGGIKAFLDRGKWPEMMQPYATSFNLKQVPEFIGRANAHRLKKRL